MGLNLSENFSSFARQAGPLCETLVQILHHEDMLMELLAEYIGKRDAVSLEPLLDLLASFVQDLAQRFEKHFSKAISLVASIAGSHPDVEVMEWSFTCLAYIFKSLSRLLVPDLCATLEIMSPYLGKERQKGFVVRFAAESMSYLIRKAGARYQKDKMPLKRAVSFLFQDLQNVGEVSNIRFYTEGLMNLLSEAVRGIQAGLHSAGSNIIHCMLEVVFEQRLRSPSGPAEVVAGTVTNIIHNTNAETFSPILDRITEHIGRYALQAEPSSVDFSIHLLCLVTGARKGSRIRNWKKIIESLLLILDITSSNSGVNSKIPELFAATVVTLQEGPMDQLLPSMQPLMDAVSNGNNSKYFLGFCSLWSRLESNRFENIVLPYLQK